LVLALAAVLGACATRIDAEADRELADYLRSQKDAAILAHFEARRRGWDRDLSNRDPSIRESAATFYYWGYNGEWPKAISIAVSDRPGEDASPSSPLGAALRRTAAQLRANGIDVQIVPANRPHNFLIEAMPPGAFTAPELAGRFSERNVRPDLKAANPQADLYARSAYEQSKCKRQRFYLVQRPVEMRDGDILAALRSMDRPPARYAGALQPFSAPEFETLAHEAGRDDVQKFWVDLSIACGLNALVYSNDDLDRYRVRESGGSSHGPSMIWTIESVSDPALRLREASFVAPPGRMYIQRFPPEIPPRLLSTIRAIIYLNTPIDWKEPGPAHFERLRERLGELRKKYDAPEPQ
jgi:hypothetical protein